MKHFLTEAFNRSHSIVHKIADVHHHAGLMAMRLMYDSSFLDIDHGKIRLTQLHGPARTFNTVMDVGQQKLASHLEKMLASGDVGPKPDFKKPLIAFVKTALPYAAKLNLSQVAVVTLTAGVALAAAHIATHGGSESLQYIMGNFLGVKTNGSPEVRLGLR